MRRVGVLAMCICLFLAGHAHAANFKLGGDASLNCRVSVSGQIVPGDAEKFRAILVDLVNSAYDFGSDFDPHRTRWGSVDVGLNRICLDSPGGSITEAIKMADTLAYGFKIQADIAPLAKSDWAPSVLIPTLGTAIPAGATCESACAVLFMAGGYFLNIGPTLNLREADRVLHVKGKLGFHAPKLTVDGGRYDEASVARAFDLAVGVAEQLSQRLSRYRFPPSLFAQMVSTPPDDMFYIDTVRKAASWEIQLAGAPLLDAPTFGNLVHMCENMTVLSRTDITGAEQYSKETIPVAIRDQSQAFFSHTPKLGHAGTYHWKNVVTDKNAKSGPVMELDIAGWRDCGARYDVASGEVDVFRLAVRDHGLAPFTRPTGWALFPGQTTLDELSGLMGRYPSGRVPPTTLISFTRDELRGFCALYDRRGALIQSDDCLATLTSKQRADRTGHFEVLETVWPDGAKTLTSFGAESKVDDTYGPWTLVGNLETTWNDGPEGGSYEAPQRLKLSRYINLGGCMTHADNGTTRCFKMVRVIRSEPSGFRR